eukprot:TRINITY_DN23317_c0_g1_i2.p2 TRINITY_DN23317_c0_g1~~TRINITY_DN23317_c0_g1_i2.p2  ORF type:complete len:125 (+),score=0.72 TRINITY_DN23317_c0_g1_i2:117-491(+)
MSSAVDASFDVLLVAGSDLVTATCRAERGCMYQLYFFLQVSIGLLTTCMASARVLVSVTFAAVSLPFSSDRYRWHAPVWNEFVLDSLRPWHGSVKPRCRPVQKIELHRHRLGLGSVCQRVQQDP